MLHTTLKNTRQGSRLGNVSGGSVVTIEHPSSGCFIMGIKKCLICEEEFIPKRRDQKYCSRRCSVIMQLRKRSKKPLTKICKHCDVEFKPYNSLDKFCSANCRIENMKSKRLQNRRWSDQSIKNRMGKKNPGYRNGNYVRGVKRISSRVFENIIKSIKESMIDDVGYIYCQHCDTSNSLKFEGHHIIYKSEKPKHKDLHDKRNAILLCIQCHNEFHKHKGMRNEIVNDRKLNELFGNDVLNK